MFVRLIALGILVSMMYSVGVFIAPSFFDTYGNSSLNAKIRNIKNISLEISSGSESPISLFEKMTNTSKTYIDETKKTIDETKKTYENITTTLSGKVQEVKTAADSIEKAYDAINAAKADIDKVMKTASGTSSGIINIAN